MIYFSELGKVATTIKDMKENKATYESSIIS